MSFMGLNMAIIMGRLGRDPEVRYTQSGKKMAKFSIATNRPAREGQQDVPPDWHNVVAWDKTAEIAEKYLRKGDVVLVIGRNVRRSWHDPKSNEERYTHEVVIDRLVMAPKPSVVEAPPAPTEEGPVEEPEEPQPF